MVHTNYPTTAEREVQKRLHAYNARKRKKAEKLQKAMEDQRKTERYLVRLRNGKTFLPKTKKRYEELCNQYLWQIERSQILR